MTVPTCEKCGSASFYNVCKECSLKSKVWMLVGLGHDYYEIIAIFTDENAAKETLARIEAIKPFITPGRNYEWSEVAFKIEGREFNYEIDPHRWIKLEERVVTEAPLQITDCTDRREICKACAPHNGAIVINDKYGGQCGVCYGGGRLPYEEWRKEYYEQRQVKDE